MYIGQHVLKFNNLYICNNLYFYVYIMYMYVHCVHVHVHICIVNANYKFYKIDNDLQLHVY